MAEKLEWLMADIERFAQSFTSAERLRRLSLLRPLVSGVIPATFTDIVECRLDGEEWRESARCTVPQLQEFLSRM